MELVNLSEVEKLKKQLEKCPKHMIVDHLLSGYADQDDFHKRLMRSGFLLGMTLDDIKKLTSNPIIQDSKTDQIKNDLAFVEYVTKTLQDYDQEISILVGNYKTKLYLEDFLYFLEVLHHQANNYNLGPDKKVYPSSIAHSMYNHVLDTLPEIIDLVNNLKIDSSGKAPLKFNDEPIRSIFRLVGIKVSLKSKLLAVFSGLYRPRIIDNFRHCDIVFDKCYDLLHNPDYWKMLETYRDLNYLYYTDHFSSEETLSIMKACGALKRYSKEIIHIDASCDTEYDAERER